MSRRYSNSRRRVSFPPKTKLGMSLGKGPNANVVKTVSKGGLFASNGVEAGWKIVKVNTSSVDSNTAPDILKKAMKQDRKVKIEFQVPPTTGAESLKVFFAGKKKVGFTLESESTVVKSVEKRGAASKGGVKVGWNVVSVDGIKVDEGNIRSTLKKVGKSPKKYQVIFGSPRKNRNKMLMSLQQSPGEEKDSEQKVEDDVKAEQNENEAEDELRAKEEAEKRAKEEAEESARLEAEQKANAIAEQEAKEEAEQKAKEEAEQKAKEEAELQAKEEAEQKEREEAELKAKEEAEQRAREEAEKRAKEEAEQKAREEAEQKAREEAEQKAKEEALQRAKEEAERKATEEAEQKIKQEAEQKAQEEADQRAKEAEEQRAKEADEQRAKEEAEQRAKEEAEQKAQEEADLKAQKAAEKKASDEAEMKAKEDAERIIREEAEQKSKEDAELNSQTPILEEQAEEKAILESEQPEDTKLEQKSEGPETVVPTDEVVATQDSASQPQNSQDEAVPQVEVDTIAEPEKTDEASQVADLPTAEDDITESKQEQVAVTEAVLESKQDTAEVVLDVAEEDVKQGHEKVELGAEDAENATVEKTIEKKDAEVTMEDDRQPEERNEALSGTDGVDKDEVGPNAESEPQGGIKEEALIEEVAEKKEVNAESEPQKEIKEEAQFEEVAEKKEVETPLSEEVKVGTVAETEDEKSSIPTDDVDKSQGADSKSGDINAELSQKVEVESKPSEGDLPVETAAPVVSAT